MTQPSRSPERRTGFLGGLFRSRRSVPSAAPASTADHGAWAVDRIVRVLATACERENRGVPAVLAVIVGAETVELRLRTPDERPPADWSAEDDGRTWRAQLHRLQSAGVSETSQEAYPRLLSLGYGGAGFVLLNLSQAGGIIGLEGDARQARELAADWARELAVSPWSRNVRVVRVGFRTGAPADGVTEAPDLAGAEAALAEEAGGVLLLAAPPGGRDAERVRRLAEAPEGLWSVVVVGRVDAPRWRFTADAAGNVETGLLGGPVARRWNPAVGAAPFQEDTAAFPAIPVGEPVAAAAPSRPPRSWMVLSGAAVALLLAIGVLVGLPMLKGNGAPEAAPSGSSSPVGAASPTAVPAGGTGVIRGLDAPMCLDGDSDPVMALNGTPTGGHAFTSACDGSPTQLWTEGPLMSEDSPRTADIFRLVSAETGFCMDNNGELIYTLPCLNPNTFQMWRRITVPAPGDLEGDAVIYRNIGTEKCLSVDAADGTLRLKDCGEGGPWTQDMMFQRAG